MTNPLDRKAIEKELFDKYKSGPLQGRRTRTFLRKMARDIVHGYEIGFRDGASGKPLTPPDAVQTSDISPMRQDIFHRAYTAYARGYKDGKRGGASWTFST